MAAVTICSDFEAPKNKVCHYFTVFPSISHEGMGPDAMIFVFWTLSCRPTFSLSSFTFRESNDNPLQYSCLQNPWMEEPAGLPSVGSHRVGHDWSDLEAAAAAFTFIKRLFSSSLSAIRVVSSAYLVIDISPGNLDFSLCFYQPSISHDVLCI